MKQSRSFSFLLAATSLVGLLGCAQSSLAARATYASRLVEVMVVNRITGERLTPYRHQGKLYVAGSPGDPYQIEIASRRGERLLTVLSVDGVNVLSGEAAAPSQSGYVLAGGQRYGISGWRKDMNDVAQFVFTALPDSYAARTGRPGNVGVIGVAVFREKALPPPVVLPMPTVPAVGAAAAESRDTETLAEEMGNNDARSRQSAASPAAKGALADAAPHEAERAQSRDEGVPSKKAMKLGTGHGDREYSPTRYTAFERASSTPDEILTLYYDSRANLIARGIIPSPRLAVPNPFPGDSGFAPDPRG